MSDETRETAVSELKPCPFCGGTDLETSPFSLGRHGSSSWTVVCGNQGCLADVEGISKENAIARWNRRAQGLSQQERDAIEDGYIHLEQNADDVENSSTLTSIGQKNVDKWRASAAILRRLGGQT